VRTARRYGLLLAILISSYLLSAFFSARWISDAQIVLFSATVLLAIRSAPMRRRTVRVVVSAGIVVSVLMIIVGVHEGGDVGRGVAGIWTGMLLLLTVVLVLRHILMLPAVTAQSIYGAISVYLIIGLMFASWYSAMYWLNGRTFFSQGSHLGATSDFQYFSFTTLTTLGYGDLTAARSAGRAIAVIEAMTGQIFLATLVAKLVASFRPARTTAPGQDD
jgi:hypothetical protein